MCFFFKAQRTRYVPPASLHLTVNINLTLVVGDLALRGPILFFFFIFLIVSFTGSSCPLGSLDDLQLEFVQAGLLRQIVYH